MPYDWEFFTSGRPVDPVGRRCHRGPMIEFEERMALPFSRTKELEVLRVRLLDKIVDTPLVAVQTRETLLRVLNSNLSSIFVDFDRRKQDLVVQICEKRNSIDIDTDLSYLDARFLDGADFLLKFQVLTQQRDMMRAALQSASPVVRVAGRCSVIVMATYVEMS